jgi:hypothetical protein
MRKDGELVASDVQRELIRCKGHGKQRPIEVRDGDHSNKTNQPGGITPIFIRS